MTQLSGFILSLGCKSWSITRVMNFFSLVTVFCKRSEKYRSCLYQLSLSFCSHSLEICRRATSSLLWRKIKSRIDVNSFKRISGFGLFSSSVVELGSNWLNDRILAQILSFAFKNSLTDLFEQGFFSLNCSTTSIIFPSSVRPQRICWINVANCCCVCICCPISSVCLL